MLNKITQIMIILEIFWNLLILWCFVFLVIILEIMSWEPFPLSLKICFKILIWKKFFTELNLFVFFLISDIWDIDDFLTIQEKINALFPKVLLYLNLVVVLTAIKTGFCYITNPMNHSFAESIMISSLRLLELYLKFSLINLLLFHHLLILFFIYL